MQIAAENTDYKVLYEDVLIKYTALQQEVLQLKKMIFGSKQERFIPAQNNPAQLTLDMQVESTAQCNVTGAKKISYTRLTTAITENKKHPGRTKLPEHLERRDITIEPQEDTSQCKKIGEEVTEELEYEPGRLYISKTA